MTLDDPVDHEEVNVTLVHAAATWFLVGLIWIIQVVHYPLFARVGEDGFVAYEAAHTRLISLVVGPAGNSFSGPHCAGVAALVFSANPAINSWEVSEILKRTAKDLGPKGRDHVYGAGLIDALAAVRAAKKKKD